MTRIVGQNAAGVVEGITGTPPITVDNTDPLNPVVGLVQTGFAKCIRYAIGTGATQDSVTALPAGGVVDDVRLQVTTPYSLGATISIGQPAALTAFQTTGQNNPQIAATYDVIQATAALAAVVRTTIAGAPGVGAGFVSIFYSVPLP